MANWQDRTSYSRGERGTAEPRVFDLDLAGLRISIHRLHGCDGWFGTCHAMGVKDRQLEVANLETAKAEFLRYLKERAWNWADKIAAAEVSS